jgi:hypothetical protein
MLSPRKSTYFAKILWYKSGKSFPITAINQVSTKLLADIAANVSAPPKTSFRVFFGVLMVSNAVDPKTVNIL